MTIFSVPDMSCGHCKATVEAAISRVAPGAKVEVDLARHTVTTDADPAKVTAALEAEGYPATAA